MSTTTASKNKKRKNIESRSKIWDHFSKKMVKVEEDDTILEKKMTACNYCVKEIAADPIKNGTSGFNNHLRSCKKYPPNMDKTQALLNLQPVKGRDGERNLQPVKVTEATTTMAAVDLQRSYANSFDIIVTDLDLPDMDGYEFLDTIYELALGTPVIIALTSYDRSKVLKAGKLHVCGVLLKPLRLDKVKLIWMLVQSNQHIKKTPPCIKSSTKSND
ncbi:hypothetical protein Droror1_Dr00023358 [Drosera rotundifolia]